jgi:site-specific DNA-methyltransferase (adenine-specific)
MIELDKIYNEDCLIGMQRIPDGTVDAVICDLPYGTTANKWDSVIPFDKLWEQYNRIAKKDAPFVLFGSEPFSTLLRMSNFKNFKYDWIWEKEQGGNFMLCKYQPYKVHEIISVFCRGSHLYNPIMEKGEPYISGKGTSGDNFNNVKKTQTVNNGSRYPRSIQRFPTEKSDPAIHFHPTQKPVDLLRYLVLTYTNQGGVVLDNCSGSGTTAIACIREKRHFICFEKDETYWKKSVERVKDEQRQLTLF